MPTVIIGIGKKKGGGGRPSMPPPEMPRDPAPRRSRQMDAPRAAATAGGGGGGSSVSPEDVCYGENDLCETCKHMGQTGQCEKYGFPVDEKGHCAAGYEAAAGGGPDELSQAGNEPDLDDLGQ